MPGKHRRIIPRRRRSAVTVTSAALAAGGLLAGSGSALLGASAKTVAATPSPTHTAAITLIVLAAPPVLPEKMRSTPAQVGTAKSAAAPVAPTNIPVKPSTAARAVTAALAQQGTPYVYGGNAPGGFDCSGLAQWIYKKVGITLPRTAAAQATTGRRVSLSELQPGDLLFFYRPVGHVVIYAGNGKIVEASQPGQPVHVRSLYLNGFVEARRIV